MKNGFKESRLLLSADLGQTETWGEKEIKERARRLAEKALEVWPRPSLPEEVLEKYRPKQKEKSERSIENYKFLSEEDALQPLFKDLQKEILALDPCVIEKFRKKRVSYSAAGTRFTTVEKDSKCLCISLFIEHHELHDPKGAASEKQVAGKKRPRSQVTLKSLDDLPYAMNLVKQALDKSLFGEGDAA